MSVFHFFAGKGGVGKTTLSAAFALAQAEAGAKVLAVSTDPAHSLGDAFSVKLGAKPKRIPVRKGSLSALELDADRALAHWLSERRTVMRAIASRGTYLDDDDIDRLLDLALPGVDELAALLELSRLAERDAHDFIVVDTAPTGHTLRLLQMPQTLRGLSHLLFDMHAKHRFVAEALGGRARSDAADALVSELADQAESLAATLRDSAQTRFHWVTLAEPMALAESLDGMRALGELGVAVEAVVCNRLTPRPDRSCALCEGMRRNESAVLAQLPSAFPGGALQAVEALEAEPRGLPALRKLARSIGPLRLRRSAATRPTSRLPGAGSAERTLDALAPAGVRLLLFGGKGGVGKTTCAAATALAIAERDPERRVLLLSTDPAHSLGDALGTALSDAPSTPAGAPSNLVVRELDAQQVLEDRRARYRDAVDLLFDALRGGRKLDASFDRQVVQDLVELQPPGMDELFGMLALLDALFPPPPPVVGAVSRPRPGGREVHRFDLVVVDTAPTGHTLRLLALPGAALSWVQALLSMLLKYRQVISLGELAEDLVQLSKELKQLQALLTDPALTRFIAVTRPAELPHVETRRMLGALDRLRIPVGAVLVNACTPAGCRRCTRASREQARFRRPGAYGRRPTPLLWAPALPVPPNGPGLRGFANTWTLA